MDSYATNLARELGAPGRETPVASVLAFADNFLEGVMANLPADERSNLLGWVADRLMVRFLVISSDEQLAQLRREFGARKEGGFLQIAKDLESPTCFGATFSLNKPEHGTRFVAVIDVRGEKFARRHFTKWHEVTHILLLTDQRRVLFHRTHEESVDPEEQLVDRIAARLAFHPRIILPYAARPLSFALLREIIGDLCPDASWESAVRGIINAWPVPAVRLRAALGLKPTESARRPVGLLPMTPANGAKLRVTRADVNEAASAARVSLFSHVRVPAHSIITRVFQGEARGEALEDLSWWERSGRPCRPMPLRVMARRMGGLVEALLVADVC